MREMKEIIFGEKVRFYRIDNDINGNPRYLIHYLYIASNFDEALKISRKIGGKKYRSKRFSGGIVFQSYNVQEDLKQIIR